jgi:beta-phosphoglucomutase
MPKIYPRTAAIFDLDGVLVDTAKYHFLAWKQLAEMLAIPFSEADNEELKGVGRMECLDIILRRGNLSLEAAEREKLAAEKNRIYLTYITTMNASNLLEGAKPFLELLVSLGIKTALASASKNARTILEKTGISNLFEAIVDGTMIAKSKPDPEVFVLAAKRLNVMNQSCVVFEDAAAGITAAHAAGMKAVGIGSKEYLREADFVIPGLTAADLTIFAS